MSTLRDMGLTAYPNDPCIYNVTLTPRGNLIYTAIYVDEFV